MTPQERSMLSDFLSKLTAMGPVAKDVEADALIKQAMTSQPDAGYMLVQNILLMQHAMTEMNNKIQQLEAKVAHIPEPTQTSFLGQESQNAVKSYFSKPQQPQAQPQTYSQPSIQNQQQSSGFGEFLKSAGTTAAGVAGGMFLYDGITSLFGGQHMQGGGFGTPAGGQNNTTINNYYGDSSQAQTDSGFLDSSDIDNPFDSSGSLSDASDEDLF